MIPCKCGYQDHRFCPLHGPALRKVIKAAHELGAEAAERVAEAFDTDGDGYCVEDVCLGCETGVLDHDDACNGPPKADTPARRAFLRFMWRHPVAAAEDVRLWALCFERQPVAKERLIAWLRGAVRAGKQSKAEVEETGSCATFEEWYMLSVMQQLLSEIST